MRPVPVLTASVIDQTGALSPAQVSALEAKLAGYERTLGTQIVVLMVPTTQPEDIADFTQRVGDAWKIGRKDVGDGLLIVVAKNDRRVRIAPAKTLEGAIPDLAARQIIDRVIVPAFRADDYAGGLNAAIDQLVARIRGEALPLPGERPARSPQGADWQDLAVFFFIAVPIAGAILTGVLGRKLGSIVTAGGAGTLAWFATTSLLIAGAAGALALLLVGVLGIGAARRGVRSHRGGFDVPPIIFGGGGGGWGGGGGGGGFSSGGGGDFGGGGASGDW
ncbi:TPM domain-containing protein [Caldimonas sp. KR1-144]|uniref:TPM domain-containing protein n=1 Tax=Caldimonas sp. KR1-144 TaxID=3400911 RepID=UPI003C07CEA0